MDHDLTEILKMVALDKVLKHHPKHCTYSVFSGDRHCSCGRDKAIQELGALKQAARISGAYKKV